MDIIILIHKDFQDMEGVYPYYRLVEEGHNVLFAGPEKKVYKGKYGYSVTADLTYNEVDDPDCIIIPGGWAPDYMRLDKDVLSIVRKMDEKKKMIASICHGGWVLASAGILKGRTITSYIAIKDDMENVGAQWKDEEVVIDDNLITSRTPDDLPAFCKAIIGGLKDV